MLFSYRSTPIISKNSVRLQHNSSSVWLCVLCMLNKTARQEWFTRLESSSRISRTVFQMHVYQPAIRRLIKLWASQGSISFQGIQDRQKRNSDKTSWEFIVKIPCCCFQTVFYNGVCAEVFCTSDAFDVQCPLWVFTSMLILYELHHRGGWRRVHIILSPFSLRATSYESWILGHFEEKD